MNDMISIADTHHIDTVVIIWKADDTDIADRARDFVASQPTDCVELKMHYAADFGPLSGFVFFAFGEQGIDEADAIVIDDFASGLPCETEMYFGAASEIFQSGILNRPETAWVKGAD